MSPAHPSAAAQPALFDDPLGMRLRVAREAQGLRVEQAAAQLRLPSAVIEALEREDWSRLGARIYVRSYLGSYLRLLGLPEALVAQAESSQPELPVLAPMSSRSRMRHTVDVMVRNGVYLVMTAVLVVPVWLVARHYQNRADVQDLTLDAGIPALETLAAGTGSAPPAALDMPAAARPDPVAPAVVAPRATEEPASPQPPLLASLSPFPAASGDDALVLRFRGESWVEVIGADGERIERRLVGPDAELRYEPGRVGHVTLGNADAVEVRRGGETIDLAPYRSANVARFAVSSDGRPGPANH